jgi:branched-chain amino acid transport system permease protein
MVSTTARCFLPYPSVLAALIGAVFVVFLPEWTGGIDIALSGVIYGVCLVLTILFARHGLAGLASAWCLRALKATKIWGEA